MSVRRGAAVSPAARRSTKEQRQDISPIGGAFGLLTLQAVIVNKAMSLAV